MPDCYICGCHIPRGESHRRRVNTGSSSGWTTRGSGSFREYHGDRSLCAACARELDRAAAASRRNLFIGVLVLGGIAAFFYFNRTASGPDHTSADPDSTVTAPAGEDPVAAEPDLPPSPAIPSDTSTTGDPVDTQARNDEAFRSQEQRLLSQIADLERRIITAQAAPTHGDTQPTETPSVDFSSDPTFAALKKAADDAEAAVRNARARGGEVITLSRQWVEAKGKLNSYVASRTPAKMPPTPPVDRDEVARLTAQLVSARKNLEALHRWYAGRGPRPGYIP